MLTIIKVSVILLLIGLLVRTAYALIDIYLDGYSNRYIANEKSIEWLLQLCIFIIAIIIITCCVVLGMLIKFIFNLF
jgi:hypothetical protein